jgi:hypothetical protein
MAEGNTILAAVGFSHSSHATIAGVDITSPGGGLDGRKY